MGTPKPWASLCAVRQAELKGRGGSADAELSPLMGSTAMAWAGAREGSQEEAELTPCRSPSPGDTSGGCLLCLSWSLCHPALQSDTTEGHRAWLPVTAKWLGLAPRPWGGQVEDTR